MTVQNHGTICLIYGDDDDEHEWLLENLPDAAVWGRGFAVEPRYVEDIVAGYHGF